MLQSLGLALVLATALFLLALGAAALAAPVRVRAFLLGFAGSPGKHLAEMALRLLVGAGFLLAAPATGFPRVLSGFGWVLLATTAVLLLLPWRWHQRFAAQAVPRALKGLPLIGLSALAAGGLLLWALTA